MDLPETLTTLGDLSLSPLAEQRRASESSLFDAANKDGFSLAVLSLVSEPAANEQIRLAAAVYFKNQLRSRWPPSSSLPIPDPEKTEIKDRIVSLMLSSSPPIRSQFSESLSIIASHDFWQSWPSLLPELVSYLRSEEDYAKINGVLGAANSIFSKFRQAFDTFALREDLRYCLDRFSAPLLDIFLRTSQIISGSIASASLSPHALRLLFESQRLCCEIFYSLNSIELPEFFEDHMREWMTEFLSYLSNTYTEVLEADGTVDSLRSAVCENLQLYMEKNEEEFKDYLREFAAAVWNLLSTQTSSPSRDQLTITGIRFLTTVSTSVHHSLFGSPETLQLICQSIVFPNIRLRDDDEELFEMNSVEYIRRDIEGSDVGTRRRIAYDLLKGLASNYKEQVITLVWGHIQKMLAIYSANPAENWKEKEAAIYLVTSLATKAGGDLIGAQLVDVENFFTSIVFPEFLVDDGGILTASALKFFTVFREQIPKHIAIALLSDVINFIRANSNVVHSYAANCIEKLLLVRDRSPVHESGPNVVALQPRYSALDINPHLAPLMINLFEALQLPDLKVNHYIMKCIMRVIEVADVSVVFARNCILFLVLVLAEVCKNPINPLFNHYLFEAIAVLIRRTNETEPSLIKLFEVALFPVLENILRNDVTDFWPYAFQIFSQLVEIRR